MALDTQDGSTDVLEDPTMRTLGEDVTGRFDRRRFSVSRSPAHVADLSFSPAFPDLPSCLDMPVMPPGGDLRVPSVYADVPPIRSLLDAALRFEDDLLPDWRADRHLYLTVDRRRVRAGGTHRNSGWHFDGMQGSRFPTKLPACHQYVLSDRLTTEFTDAATDASDLDEARHDWLVELGSQIPADRPVLTSAPMELVCMSVYQLHRSPVANEDTWRTFVRLDVSAKRQDRLGNTRNPLLPTGWEMVPRPMPESFGRPIRDASWKGATRLA